MPWYAPWRSRAREKQSVSRAPPARQEERPKSLDLLEKAIADGNDELALLLLEAETETLSPVLLAPQEEPTILHAAARKCGYGVMRALLRLGLSARLLHEDSTPLHVAARHDSIGAAWAIVEHDERFVGLPDSIRLSGYANKAGENPLHHAAKANAAGVTRLLLNHGDHRSASRPRTYEELSVPIYYAARANAVDSLRLLLEHAAAVEERCRSRIISEALKCAAEANAVGAAQLLLQHGCEATDDRLRALVAAAGADAVDVARLLLQHTLSRSAPPPRGALRAVSVHRGINCNERLPCDNSRAVLPKYGIDLNVRVPYDNSRTILHVAAYHNSVDVMRLLLPTTCSLRSDKSTHYATYLPSRVLLAEQALASQVEHAERKKAGDTPCEKSEYVDPLAFHEKAGDVNVRDREGRTPLHSAIIGLLPTSASRRPGRSSEQKKDPTAAIRLLLEHGASPRSLDDGSNTPAGYVLPSHRYDRYTEMLDGRQQILDLLRESESWVIADGAERISAPQGGAKAPAVSDTAGTTADGTREISCAICLGGKPGAVDLRLACGHEVHETCLNRWRARRSDCPTCKKRLVLRYLPRERASEHPSNNHGSPAGSVLSGATKRAEIVFV